MRQHKWTAIRAMTLAFAVLAVASSTLTLSRPAAGHEPPGVELIGHEQLTGTSYPVVRDLNVPALPGVPAERSMAVGVDPIVVNSNSFKCLDVANYGTSNLDNVQQWTCHLPQTQNQLWNLSFVEYFIDQGNVRHSVYNFKESGTNECLEAYNWGVKDGTNVDIYACAPAGQHHGNQMWIADGGSGRLYNFGATVARSSWIALDVVCTAGTGYGKNSGANVQLWHQTSTNSCGGKNQEWDW